MTMPPSPPASDGANLRQPRVSRPRVSRPLFAGAVALTACVLLAACAGDPPPPPEGGDGNDTATPETVVADTDTRVAIVGDVRVTRHEGADDLLTAGLGLAGLRAPAATVPADPMAPTAAELRRIAFHANWRGIADLTPGGGVEAVYPELPAVAGEEHHALLRLPGRNAPHRAVVQVPDAFDPARPCIVVAPASGSRGVYGAIAVAGPWALPKGCALAMTDKGAGTDVFDPASASGAALDGTRAPLSGSVPLAFAPPGFGGVAQGEMRLALRHMHSQDNPEADWGAHVLQTARFALQVLSEKFGRDFGPGDTRILAVAISNGGGAVLQAAELDAGGLLDAVVAGEPNIHVAGARSLFDYATEAALLQPCALLDARLAGTPFNTPALAAAATARCASLRSAGLVEGADTAAQAAAAYDALRASGWSAEALAESALNTSFDLWRAIAAGYASAYARASWDAMPCGYAYAVTMPDGTPMPAPPVGLAMWWAMGSGIPPMLGIGLLDTMAAQTPDDAAFAGLRCLRALNDGDDGSARALADGIRAIRATGIPAVPTIVLHGRSDGLVPPAFTSRPYVARALAKAEHVRYWEIEHAQHFDAFLAVPDLFVRHVPMLPYVWQALDQTVAWLDGGEPPSPSQLVRATPRNSPAPLGAAQTGGLRADPGSDAIESDGERLRVPD